MKASILGVISCRITHFFVSSFYVFLIRIIHANFPEYDKKIDKFTILSKISLTTNSLNVREIDNNQNNMTAIHTPIAKAASITVTVGIPPAIIIDLSLIPFLDW